MQSVAAASEPIRLQAVKQVLPVSEGMPPVHAAAHHPFLGGVSFWETVVSGDAGIDTTIHGVVSDVDNVVTAIRLSDGAVLRGPLGTPVSMYEPIGKVPAPPPARPRRGALWRRARFVLDDGSRIGQPSTGAGDSSGPGQVLALSAIVDGMEYGTIAADIAIPARPVVLFTSSDPAHLPAASILGALRADACEDAIRGGAAVPAPEGALSHGGLLWSKTYPTPLLSRANRLRPLQQLAARMLHNRQVVLSATTGARVPVVGAVDKSGKAKISKRTEAEVLRVVSQRALPPNRWSHLAFVMDGQNAKIYINGEVVANRTVPAGLQLMTDGAPDAPALEVGPSSGAGADDDAGDSSYGGLVGVAADDFEAEHEVSEAEAARMPPTDLESPHPYPDNSNNVQQLSFPGAESIVIRFDERSRTEDALDYVRVLRGSGASPLDYWGEPKYFGGHEGTPRNFPGTDGRAPLIVPSDSCAVMFRSNPDGSDWGYKLTASPVYPEVTVKPTKQHGASHSTARVEQELVLGGVHPLTLVVPCKKHSFSVDYKDFTVRPTPEVTFGTFTMPGLMVSEGKWYFEYEYFGGSSDYVQIGVADTSFEPAGSYDGVGDDAHSWGFDGGRRCLWHDGSKDWGRKHNNGSIYQICLDLDAKIIRFGLDGSYDQMGDAYTGITFKDGLFPAATPARQYLRVRIGGQHGLPLKHGPPAGYKALGERAAMPGQAAVAASLQAHTEDGDPLAALKSARATVIAQAAASAKPALAMGSGAILPSPVLVIGGKNPSGTAAASTEVWQFDPTPNDEATAGTWTQRAHLPTPRFAASAAMLKDGRVLVIGGKSSKGKMDNLTTCAMYDPAKDTWEVSPATMSTGRSYPVAVPLPNGTVLVCGGHSGKSALASAEIFTPASLSSDGQDSWKPAADMPGPLSGSGGCVLPDGRVVVAGGTDGKARVRTAYQYDPILNAWSLFPREGVLSSVGRSTPGLAVTDASSGRLMLVGGFDQNKVVLSKCESISASGATEEGEDAPAWESSVSMPQARRGHCTVGLGAGKVLVLAGFEDVDSRPKSQAFLFDSNGGSGQAPVWSPMAVAPMPQPRSSSAAVAIAPI